MKQAEFAGQEILIFTVGRNEVAPFYFNPKVKPPGVEEHVWTKQLAQIIEKVYLLGPGANDVFMESSHLDTFADMKEAVLNQKKKARELLWWASVKRTLNAINYPGFGRNGQSSRGPFHSQTIEQESDPGTGRPFRQRPGFCDRIIAAMDLSLPACAQPEREVLKHFMIIEEAHHLFLNNRLQEDLPDQIMREIRELGESIVIIDQHPSKMSTSALGNLATKFCLSLSLNQDVKSGGRRHAAGPRPAAIPFHAHHRQMHLPLG